MILRLIVCLSVIVLAAACGDAPSKGKAPTNNANNVNNVSNNTNNAPNNVNNVSNNANNTPNNVNNVAALCGNGALDPGEACDPAIASGDGACPTSCTAPACTTVTLVGSASDCSAACEATPVACMEGDGCCPRGCDSESDGDCQNVCGNGTIEEPELCDGNCPSSCNDGNACTVDALQGDPATCSSFCSNSVITQCVGGDGCCPANCTNANDSDCEPTAVCGNGDIEPGETCDGNCPTSCVDNDVCTSDRVAGSAATCNVICENRAITSCINGDGCCPPGCTSANDSDCGCVPDTCASLGLQCGPADNGCNSTIDCGTCSGNDICNQGTCVPPSTGDGEIGDACTADTDCKADPDNALSAPVCLAEDAGGYCALICFGDIGFPLPGVGCPAGSTCTLVTDASGTESNYCLQNCTSNSDCRIGFSCIPLDNGQSVCFR